MTPAASALRGAGVAASILLSVGGAVAQPAFDAPLPGTVFIYSDGRVERFERAEGETCVWATRAGREYVRSANPMLPIQAWQIGERSGASEVHGASDGIWPPQRGGRAQFRVLNRAVSGARESRSVQAWTCRVGRAETTKTPAGSFETLPIACQLFSVGSMRLLENRTWWWSPELGHYLRRKYQSLRTGEVNDIRLCAALPESRATGARIDAILAEC
jgi:hypothetical protein